jgi:phosphoglycerate dehydrogenase-like enzyme
MLDKLSNKYEITTFPNSPTYISKELFLHRCQDAEIIINFFSTQLTAEILAKCKNLKTIVSPALSLGFIDQKACKKLGIQTISLDIEKNYKRSARREFVIAALFSLLRPIHTATQDIKMGRFKYSDFNAQEIGGKKIGIVGTKREGKAIIDILRAFGTAIFIANPDNPSACPTELGVNEFVTLEELFEQTDIVVFPEEYNHKLDITPFLSKKDIPQYLLFLSATVEYDLDKLRELIIQKTLSGIFIDYFPEIFKVFKDFPNSQYRKIMNFPNVVITPEIGFYTEESMRENYNQVFKILSQL